jgi:hypothetical protein
MEIAEKLREVERDQWFNKDRSMAPPKKDEAREVTGEVHEGLCGAHQSDIKTRCVLRRAGLYWSTMLDDCVWYS